MRKLPNFETLTFQQKGREMPGRKFDGTKCPRGKLKALKFQGRYIKNPSSYSSQRVGFNSFPNPKNGLSRASRTSQILKQEFLVKWPSIKAASKCFAYLEKFSTCSIDFCFSKVLNYFDYFFTCVFTLEILIKVIHFLYFRQPRYFVLNKKNLLWVTLS